jgi:mono/diheme cytochrome c family protein
LGGFRRTYYLVGGRVLKKHNFIKKIYWTLGAVVSIVAYNNCGEGFVAQSLGGGSAGGSVLFSRAPGESCEDALLKVYKSTYHPFLVQTCNSCHVSGGGGNGIFAENDPSISYNSFASKGAPLINSQAIGSHKPPYTGPQNEARVTEIGTYWGKAQTEYASCASQSGNTTPGAGSAVVKSSGKVVAATLATTFVRMEWDLETLSDAKIPVIVGIEIRKAVIAGETKGYEFRNPTLRLKNATVAPYAMRALNIYINNELQSEITTYSNISTTISTTNDTNIAVGYANAITVMTPATTDMISLEYSNLKSTVGTTTPGATPTPTPGVTPTPTPVGAVTYSQLVAAGGIFANSCISCHSAANAAGGLNLAIYANARNAAANIRTRVNNANNPMPTGGLLPQAQRDRVNAWVDQGAPQ